MEDWEEDMVLDWEEEAVVVAGQEATEEVVPVAMEVE